MSKTAFGTKFQNKEVPGDGSCLVHSICEALDVKYRHLPPGEQRRNYVRKLRADLAQCITEHPDFQEYILSELPGIRDSHYPGVTSEVLFKNLAAELLSNHSLFYYHAPILGYYFSFGNTKIDIVLLQADVISGKRKGIPVYGLATHNYIKGKAKAYVFVMCTANHYSLLISEDGSRSLFSGRDPCVNALLELLKTQV